MSADIQAFLADSRFIEAIDALRDQSEGCSVLDSHLVSEKWSEFGSEWPPQLIREAANRLYDENGGRAAMTAIHSLLEAMLLARKSSLRGVPMHDPSMRKIELGVAEFASDVIQALVRLDCKVFDDVPIDPSKLRGDVAVFAANLWNAAAHDDILRSAASVGGYLSSPSSASKSKNAAPASSAAAQSRNNRTAQEPMPGGEFTPSALAKIFSVPVDALRKRLERYRKSNADGWTEATNRKPRESRYRYKHSVAMPIAVKLKADLKKKSAKK